MKNVDWNELLHVAWHFFLLVGAAYCASHTDWAWATVAFQGLGQMTPTLKLPPGGLQVIKNGTTAAMTLLCLLLVGCTGNAAVIEALAKDNATVCVKVTTIYGTLVAARTNIAAGDVSCGDLSVKSTGTTSVPVTVTPVPPESLTPVSP